MISSIEFENFKCFQRLRLEFGALTLLTGYNSAGKSTVTQPILVLAQRLRRNSKARRFPLNGSLVRLGSVGDVVPSDAIYSNIQIAVSVDAELKTWQINPKAGEWSLLATKEIASDMPLSDKPGKKVVKALRGLTYISAVREGTPDSFPVPDFDGRSTRDVGNDGRFAAYEYNRAADDAVPLERCFPGEPATSMRKQVDAWLASLFPGAQTNVQSLPLISRLCLQFRLSDIGEWRRPINVGYGFTYVFPIIVALITAKKGQTIIIDSPESHLHPFAQSKMGHLLAHFASAGVQIIVETHSDHLLNGVRIAVQRKTISNNNLKIHFFTGVSTTDHGIKTLSIDPDGAIYDWPSGFFDQSEKDLSSLAGWDEECAGT